MKKHLRALTDPHRHPISDIAACTPTPVTIATSRFGRTKLLEIAQSDGGVTCTRCRRILDQMAEKLEP